MGFKGNKSKLMLVLLTLLTATKSFATPTCDQVLSQCDKAVQAQKKQIAVRDQELAETQLILKANAAELEDLKRSRDAWYNSKLLWAVIGAGASAYLIKK